MRSMSDFDLIIIGAGPVGLAFAGTLAESGLKVAIIEQLPRAALESPAFDGREIALTHASVATLRACGAWQHVPSCEVSPLQVARVWNGSSSYHLQIAKPDSQAKPLALLVSNQLLRRAAWACAAAAPGVEVLCESRVISLASAPDALAPTTLCLIQGAGTLAVAAWFLSIRSGDAADKEMVA